MPVICRAQVEAQSISVHQGLVPIGTMHEFCNSPGGYEVWADYSPGLAGASLVVDGQTVALSASGSTRISYSSHAAIDSHDLALNLPDNEAQGNISVRIVAL